MTFDPNAHLTKLKGKDYLEVKWRLVWFRKEHPEWGIHTEVVQFDERLALVKATITDGNGLVMAQGHKQEQPGHFPDYLEKAETGAIGRALGVLGYGTQFAPEFEEGDRIVDGPVNPKSGGALPPHSGNGGSGGGSRGRPAGAEGSAPVVRGGGDPPVAAIRQTDLGELFSCVDCGGEYAAARTKDGITPARQWLEELPDKGINAAVCVDCARKRLKGGR